MKHRIHVEGTDIAFNCDEEDSVLNAMIHHGKGPVKLGCCGGGCGVCKVRVISGDYYAFKPMSTAHVDEAGKKEGIVLLCCIQPRSDLYITKS